MLCMASEQMNEWWLLSAEMDEWTLTDDSAWRSTRDATIPLVMDANAITEQ